MPWMQYVFLPNVISLQTVITRHAVTTATLSWVRIPNKCRICSILFTIAHELFWYLFYEITNNTYGLYSHDCNYDSYGSIGWTRTVSAVPLPKECPLLSTIVDRDELATNKFRHRPSNYNTYILNYKRRHVNPRYQYKCYYMSEL